MKKEIVQVISNTNLIVREKTKKTKELGELIEALQKILNIGKDMDNAHIEKNIDVEQKMDLILKNQEINNYKGYILLSRKDEYGFYYTFKNLDGNIVKYYYENDNYKFNKKLSKIEEIPIWFRSLSRYLKSWNFDDVTQLTGNIKIDKNEEEIIRNIVINSMTGNMENYDLDEKSGIEAILFIRQLLGEEFPRRVKDRMWKELIVDEFCTEPKRITKEFMYMVNLEKWSHIKDDFTRINDNFLKTKIEELLTKNVKQEMINNFLTGKLKGDLRQLNVEQYIKAIRDSIRSMNVEYCESKNLTRIEKRRCINCDSCLHYAKNCRKINNTNTYLKGMNYNKEEKKLLRPSEINESEY